MIGIGSRMTELFLDFVVNIGLHFSSIFFCSCKINTDEEVKVSKMICDGINAHLFCNDC